VSEQEAFKIALIVTVPMIISIVVVYRIGLTLFTQLTERVLSLRRWGSYHEYLSSWVWRSKRERIKRRDKGACALCNSRVELQVHHREYPEHYGFEPDDDLVTLCRYCHTRYHGIAVGSSRVPGSRHKRD
jgi:HNH endonuclease